MSFLTTSDIIRQLFGLPKKESSRIRINCGYDGMIEFDGWKITRKVWRYQQIKITGIVYKTQSHKVILEFKLEDFVKTQTIHKTFEYESVADAIKDMKMMQGDGDK